MINLCDFCIGLSSQVLGAFLFEWFAHFFINLLNVIESANMLYVCVAVLSLGVLNAVVFGMDRETLNRLNLTQMKVCKKAHMGGGAVLVSKS